MVKFKDLSEDFLSKLSKEEKYFLLAWKILWEDKDFQNKIKEINEVELEKILKPLKVKTIYNLEKGDRYYIVSDDGLIHETRWDNHFVDSRRLTVGNVFLTKEEAEFALEKLKVKAELKRYASMCETEVGSNLSQSKYSLFCDYKYLNVGITCDWSQGTDTPYFTDKSILQQAIKEIGKERIIKYYFGVKGE